MNLHYPLGSARARHVCEVRQGDEDEFSAGLRDALPVSPCDGCDAHATPSDFVKSLMRGAVTGRVRFTFNLFSEIARPASRVSRAKNEARFGAISEVGLILIPASSY